MNINNFKDESELGVQRFPEEYYEADGTLKVPQRVLRGLGRTSIAQRSESGLPFTVEGRAVQAQMKINQESPSFGVE